eukprot:scaffold65511_cov83-Cyclotella_meneghiniana.AAC.3
MPRRCCGGNRGWSRGRVGGRGRGLDGGRVRCRVYAAAAAVALLLGYRWMLLTMSQWMRMNDVPMLVVFC